MPFESNSASHPLSELERTAISRYVANIKEQLQVVSELLESRHGRESTLASLSAKALVFTVLLEDELIKTQSAEDLATENQDREKRREFGYEESGIVKTVAQGR
jgi:hypothetical protein